MILDSIFLFVIVGLIVVIVHLNAKLRATNAVTAQTNLSLSGIPSAIASEADLLGGLLKAKIDGKFEAFGKWLVNEIKTELQKLSPTTPTQGTVTAPAAETVLAAGEKAVEGTIAVQTTETDQASVSLGLGSQIDETIAVLRSLEAARKAADEAEALSSQAQQSAATARAALQALLAK